MLQILLLLGLIVEDIDLGKEEKVRGGRGKWVKGWGGAQFMPVIWPTENVFFLKLAYTHTHSLQYICNRFQRSDVQIKMHLWIWHHRSSFWPHFHPPSLIWSSHSTIGSMRKNAGVSHTNVPIPASLALTPICVGQVHHPVLPQVPVNECQYAGLAGRQGLERESMRGW